MSSTPAPAWRALWILARMGVRRWANRMQVVLHRRKSAKEGQRTATPRKRRGGAIMAVAIGIAFLFMAMNLAGGLFASLAQEVGYRGSERIPLSPMTYRVLRSWAASQRPADAPGRAEGGAPRSRASGEPELGLLRHEALQRGMKAEDANALAEEWGKVLREKGVAGFRPSGRVPAQFWPSADLWPRDGDEASVVRAVGAVLVLAAVALFFTALGGANRDLGQADWQLEWLFTFPTRAGTLFLGKAAEYALVSAFAFFLFFPFLLCVFWSAGYGWWAVPLGLAATFYLVLLLAGLRVLTETWLRVRLGRVALKNVQALCTIVGMVCLLFVLYLAQSQQMPGWFVAFAGTLPDAALAFPLSLPAVLCKSGPAALWGAAWMPVVGVGLVALCVRGAAWLVRRGLVAESGPYGGVRRVRRPAREGQPLAAGMPGKDLRLLLRDRNFLVSTLFVPAVIVGFNVLINPGTVRAMGRDFHHVAVMAFAIGAYTLLFSAMTIVQVEQRALWLLYTFPQRLDRLLVRKAALWAILGLVYPVLVLGAGAAFGSAWHAEMASDAALVLAGVVIHAFIAAGLGALSTDPFEEEPSRRMRVTTMYLYFLLAGLYAHAIYNPSAWHRLGQIVLSGLLAVAIWQKVRDRAPFLLDPTQAPPPRLGLSDGLIAALAFFAVQGIVTVFCQMASRLSPGEVLLTAYLVAGVTVALGTLLVFWSAKVPDLLRTLGVRRGVDAPRRAGSLLAGVIGGGLAAALAIAYFRGLDLVEPLRAFKEEALFMARPVGGSGWWIVLLAVAVAPLCEEYLFRGLVFGGMRRSLPRWVAVLGSAAVFALVHPVISVVPVFVLGLAAALLFDWTRWLAAPVVAHMAYNAIVLAAQ